MALSDAEYLEANAHITSAEVRQDIQDTQEEINRLQSGRAMSFGTAQDRLDLGRATLAREGIEKRKAFIADLQRLLRLRGEAEEPLS